MDLGGFFGTGPSCCFTTAYAVIVTVAGRGSVAGGSSSPFVVGRRECGDGLCEVTIREEHWVLAS
ncbi:hypothetical protein GCM10010346_60990 [Streptomyces chryseus]|uniref:Secreted protein n=1 Tax=Streptomyces chryseus TaxID=68186 RepID=A0ABQ3E7S2_9ACTN|nr:hypothetical protein GCM10010346_60990 [Streptomyces chryseus]